MSKNGGSEPVAAESYAMTGGDGTYSYTKNSSLQRTVADAVKEKIDEAINEKLDTKSLFATSTTICIADFGCSVGPNTFIAMQNMVEAVTKKYQAQNPQAQLPEFQVFFNDQVSNDFNTLFATLPPGRQYFTAGVPGSFRGRLFPENSLHLAYSSSSLHWLSKVPEEVLDQNSPAWNKGRIHYVNSPGNVVHAYASEFARAMEMFLNARAKELVAGGIMVLNILARPNWVTHSQSPLGVTCDFMESCFIDMVKEGLINEALVDCFNLPLYVPSVEEFQDLVDRNGCFDVERMELKPPTSAAMSATINQPDITSFSHKMMMHRRATMGAMISKHFGIEIIDEIFDRYRRKFVEFPLRMESAVKQGSSVFTVLTKRKS